MLQQWTSGQVLTADATAVYYLRGSEAILPQRMKRFRGFFSSEPEILR
ncbi:hypothetical protein A2U01_0112728, partial [Trifolium medium]|nr:hypothetical protein [Trifolium medium]